MLLHLRPLGYLAAFSTDLIINLVCTAPPGALSHAAPIVSISRREQAALKDEMEKMSELISELRENCQKLQTQLLEVRQISREQKSVGVQV